jgi:hypothetical protein
MQVVAVVVETTLRLAELIAMAEMADQEEAVLAEDQAVLLLERLILAAAVVVVKVT